MYVYHGLLSELLPTRTTQLNPATWIAAGYNEQDTYEFMRSYTEALYHPNMRIDSRFRGNVAYVNVWTALTASLLNVTTTEWMRMATDRTEKFLYDVHVSDVILMSHRVQ